MTWHLPTDWPYHPVNVIALVLLAIWVAVEMGRWSDRRGG